MPRDPSPRRRAHDAAELAAGFTRQYQSDDGWQGQSYRQGFETYSDFTRPNDESRHCRSYELSGTVHAECDR